MLTTSGAKDSALPEQGIYGQPQHHLNKAQEQITEKTMISNRIRKNET
jgi:hypothetical protein